MRKINGKIDTLVTSGSRQNHMQKFASQPVMHALSRGVRSSILLWSNGKPHNKIIAQSWTRRGAAHSWVGPMRLWPHNLPASQLLIVAAADHIQCCTRLLCSDDRNHLSKQNSKASRTLAQLGRSEHGRHCLTGCALDATPSVMMRVQSNTVLMTEGSAAFMSLGKIMYGRLVDFLAFLMEQVKCAFRDSGSRHMQRSAVLQAQ